MNHFCDTKQAEKAAWIKLLLAQGKFPVMEIVEEIPFEGSSFREAHYINLYKSLGCDLFNKPCGGKRNNKK